jgi:hypothetical protein
MRGLKLTLGGAHDDEESHHDENDEDGEHNH